MRIFVSVFAALTLCCSASARFIRYGSQKEFDFMLRLDRNHSLLFEGPLGDQMRSRNAQFAVNLLRKCARPNESIVLSPASLQRLASLLILTTTGQTSQQIKDIFMGETDIEDYVGTFLLLQENVINDAILQRVNLKTAAFAFGEDITSLQHYSSTTLDNQEYQFCPCSSPEQLRTSPVCPCKPEETLPVLKKYRVMMAEMPERNGAVFNMSYVLRNTKCNTVIPIFFTGNWAKEFREENTRQIPFCESEGKQREVPMMMAEGEFFEAEPKCGFRTVKIDFEIGGMSIAIFLPNDKFGLAEAEKQLTGDILTKDVYSGKMKHMKIALPKFNLESKLQLNNALIELGITDPFMKQPQEPTALPESEGVPLTKLLEVTHQTFFKIDEKGSGATESKGIFADSNSTDIEHGADFIADHPFLFAVLRGQNIFYIGHYY